MYIADTFNRKGFFQRLGSFIKKNSPVSSQLNEILFNATIVDLNISRIHWLKEKCLHQVLTYKSKLVLNTDRTLFWSPTSVEILALIPAALSSLVIMQNKIFPSFFPKLKDGDSSPFSFSDVIKKIKKWNLDPKIVDLTENYWSTIGSKLRDYRDIAEHHEYLMVHSFFVFNENKGFVLYLPDNPAIKSVKQYTFDQKIDAVDFIEDAFLTTHKYIEDLLNILGYPSSQIDHSVTMDYLPPLEIGKKKTVLINVFDSEGKNALEIGHNEDRTIYLQALGDWAESEPGSNNL